MRRRFVSVGTKLTGAMLVVLAAMTVIAYLEVSRSDRERLLSAKEQAATMLTDLFAAGVTAPLSFRDDAGVREHVALLMTNATVMYAGVWGATGGRVDGKIAETARSARVVDPSTLIPQHGEVERTVDAVVVQKPVTDSSGEVLGVVVVEFSLSRENATIAAAQRRTLAISLATGLGLAGVLLALSRTLVVRRLAQLAKAANRLEQGDVVDINLDTNDEVGALARAFMSMSEAIATREVKISSRNRDLRRVLDNVAEGLMTVKKSGTISDERSRAVDEWFGAPAQHATLFEYFETFAPAAAPLLRLGWTALNDDIMPVEVVLDQLPRRFQHQSRAYELDYLPIWLGPEHDAVVDQVLVVVRDVTATVERERVEQAQRDALNVFRRILVDPAGFREFLSRGTRLVESIEQSLASSVMPSCLKRDVHTLKGDTGLYGIESVAAICHRIESQMHDSDELITRRDVAPLRAAWNHLTALATELQSGAADDRIEVHPQEYERHLAQLQTALGSDHGLVVAVRSWAHELADRCLHRVSEQGRSLARRLGRAETVIDVQVTPPTLRLPTARWSPIWSVFSHVLRNTFDHGVESADERLAAGKSPIAHVQIALIASRGGVELRIVDDGRGIAWEKVRESAQRLGLPHANGADLEEALFADMVTTRASATEISGRGLGMGAFRDAVRACGGTLAVESHVGAGTALICRFPPEMGESPRRSLPSAASKVA